SRRPVAGDRAGNGRHRRQRPGLQLSALRPRREPRGVRQGTPEEAVWLKRLVVVAAGAIAAAGVAVALYVVHVRHEGRTIVGSSTVGFHRPRSVHPPRTTPNGVAWATYGRGAARTRSLEGVGLGPPFRKLWTWHGGALLEFPPVVAGGNLFLATFDGRLYALAARTGRAIWRYDS